MPVVVVESPAKAKTIEKYLGSGYRVLPSFGHVRDLPEKDGSVDPENGFSMKWQVQSKAQSHVKAIADALAKDSELVLATDPDREGEAISWHVHELLSRRRGLKLEGEAKRVVFNAITKSAVNEAMRTPRAIDMQLVNAYLARRALDYLVGYTLSPVLWRKLPGARSAGRVQSVCVRLIVEREIEIESFKPVEYWSVTSVMHSRGGEKFVATLSILDGKKLKKYGLSTGEAAERAVRAVKISDFSISRLESKPARSNPPPPFVTATLQQEASLKLRFNPRRTMRVAQALYEAGHITYMRTDGVDMAPEAVTDARNEIKRRFGDNYLPKSARHYKTKAKNAQEAHECIRPTDMSMDGQTIRVGDDDQRKLYEMIRRRALASQMASAVFLQATCDMLSSDRRTGLRATGRVLQFDGFQRLYMEGKPPQTDGGARDQRTGRGRSGDDREPENAKLPKMAEGEPVTVSEVKPRQHHTKPPPRYTEASLVKKMVELGIGRPSTYSSIVSTIQDRGYVTSEKGSLIPNGIGRMLNSFLITYFEKYVGYEFTAALEEELDDVSGGRKQSQDVLEQFWTGFAAAVAETEPLRIGEVLDNLSDILVPQLIPRNGDNGDLRVCPQCGNGRLRLRTGRGGGAFIGCSAYPECRYVYSMDGGGSNSTEGTFQERLLGLDPETGLDVSLKSGRFGPYVQLGESAGAGDKPKRASIPEVFQLESLDLETALALLALPRSVGEHPDSKETILAGIGRYGPYLKHGTKYVRVVDPKEVLSIGINRAVDLLARAPAGRGGRQSGTGGRTLGDHPDGGQIRLLDGRYGPYVKWNKVNASLPKAVDPDSLNLKQAIDLINAKRSRKS